MGLGKTVMTIALILAKPGRESSRKKNSAIDGAYKPKGGTLVVCPLSLLSQWKVSLSLHANRLLCLWFFFPFLSPFCHANQWKIQSELKRKSLFVCHIGLYFQVY